MNSPTAQPINRTRIFVILAAGALPLVLVVLLVARMIAPDNPHVAGGVDAIGLIVLCTAAYAFAILLIVPTLLMIPVLIARRRLVLSPGLVVAILLATCVLALPLLYTFVPPDMAGQ